LKAVIIQVFCWFVSERRFSVASMFQLRTYEYCMCAAGTLFKLMHSVTLG